MLQKLKVVSPPEQFSIIQSDDLIYSRTVSDMLQVGGESVHNLKKVWIMEVRRQSMDCLELKLVKLNREGVFEHVGTVARVRAHGNNVSCRHKLKSIKSVNAILRGMSYADFLQYSFNLLPFQK